MAKLKAAYSLVSRRRDLWEGASRVAPLRLPDMRHHFGRPQHRIAGLTPERRRELGHVRKRRVDAPLLGRMRIQRHARPQRRRARVLAIALRIGDEVTLLRREAVDWSRPAITLQRTLQRVVAREHATIVRNILA